jgi:hypothetical protein
MKRLTSILLGLAVVFPLHSCSVQGTFGRQDLLANPPTTRRFDHFAKPPGQGVVRYTTTDGVAHEFAGKAWVDGDSIVFERTKTRQRVAMADLASVVAEEADVGATVTLFLGLSATAVGAMAAVLSAIMD